MRDLLEGSRERKGAVYVATDSLCLRTALKCDHVLAWLDMIGD